MRLNKKGFTLIEVLAVLVILAMLVAFAIPNVNHLIQQTRNDSYNDLKNSIVVAAKNYVSDYRYEISIDGACSSYDKVNGVKKNIKSIEGTTVDGKIKVLDLVEKKYLKASDGKINDPRDKTRVLDGDKSYVGVQYDCKLKDYSYSLEDSNLK